MIQMRLQFYNYVSVIDCVDIVDTTVNVSYQVNVIPQCKFQDQHFVDILAPQIASSYKDLYRNTLVCLCVYGIVDELAVIWTNESIQGKV